MTINTVQLLQDRIDIVLSVADHTRISRELAEQVVSGLPIIESIVTPDEFYDTCKQIHESMLTQSSLIANQQHATTRGMLHGVTARAYSDRVCDVEIADTNYEEWFTERGIDIGSIDTDDLEIIYKDIVGKATGLDLNKETTLKELQTAMLKMLGQLSSYSVQLVGEINESGIIRTNHTAVRIGDMFNKITADYNLLDFINEVIKVKAKIKNRTEIDINQLTQTNFKHKLSRTIKLRNKITISDLTSVDIQHVRVETGDMNISTPDSVLPNPFDITDVPGLDTYLGLTEVQRQSFKSIYTGSYTGEPPISYRDIPPVADPAP